MKKLIISVIRTKVLSIECERGDAFGRAYHGNICPSVR